jgi:hypothetical protein
VAPKIGAAEQSDPRAAAPLPPVTQHFGSLVPTVWCVHVPHRPIPSVIVIFRQILTELFPIRHSMTNVLAPHTNTFVRVSPPFLTISQAPSVWVPSGRVTTPHSGATYPSQCQCCSHSTWLDCHSVGRMWEDSSATLTLNCSLGETVTGQMQVWGKGTCSGTTRQNAWCCLCEEPGHNLKCMCVRYQA